MGINWILCHFLIVIFGVMGQTYRGREVSCPHKLDKDIFSFEYLVAQGAPYRAYKTLPWRLFVIKHSAIEGAGLGVFATQFIPGHTWLGRYDGEVFSLEYVREANKSAEYAWMTYKDDKLHQAIDAYDITQSNWLRFINCAYNIHVESVEGYQCYGEKWYITKKNIYPGQELLVYYGNAYAKQRLGIDIAHYSDPI